jgi:hypothetical protein
MVYDVFVRRSNGMFTAIVLGLPNIIVKARSRAEAIRRAQAAADKLLAEGELVRVAAAASSAPRPLTEYAGMWANDDTFTEFSAAMADYRKLTNPPSTVLKEKPGQPYRARRQRRKP